MAAPLQRVAYPSSRDLAASTARFAQLTPATLASVLSRLEQGLVRDWADVCDRILSDSHIRGDYETRLASIAGADYELEPGQSGDPERDQYAEGAARFIGNMLEGMGATENPLVSLYDSSGFRSSIVTLLDGFRVGFGAAEIDWQYRGDELVAASLWWTHQRRFQWMRPKWELVLTDGGGDALASGYTQLPRDRFAIHVPRLVAGYPTAMASFRAVAWNYLFKRWTMQFWVVGAEKYAWPTAVGTVPSGTDKSVREAFLADIDAASVDHSIVMDAENSLKLVETTVKDGGTWQSLCTQLNRESSKTILGMTDASEPTKVGAFGAVESRRGMTVNPRIAVDDQQVSETYRLQVFTPALKFNRKLWNGVIPPAPKLKFAIAATRTPIPQSVIDAGGCTVNELRESAGLKKLSGPEGEKLVTPKSAGPAPVPAAA